MEETHVFKCYSFLIILLINLFSVNQVESKTFKVGDEEGWTQGVNYVAWSENNNFTVGDVLVFNYVKEQHNVYEVTEMTYKSCNGSTGVLNTYDSGNDQLNLTEAKKYWFICNVFGHCLGGMRFGVDVKEVSLTNNSVTPPPPLPEMNSSPPTGTNGIYFQGRGWVWVCIVAFGILLMI